MSFFWTKYSPLEGEVSLQDPLAFDYFAQTLGNVILPAFTSRTSRARYYSMVCYGIYITHKYLESIKAPITEESIKKEFVLYEKYWARAIAGWYNISGGGLAERDGKEEGFRGKRAAISAAKNANLTSLGERYTFLTRQLELGSFGAYRSSLEYLELVDSFLHLTHKGKRLADSFIEDRYAALVQKAIKEERIVEKEGQATLHAFGSKSRLDAFKDDSSESEEQKNLREMIMDHPSVSTPARLIKRYYGNGNVLSAINSIAAHAPSSPAEEIIVCGFQTIEACEILCVHLSKIWCSLIDAAIVKLNVVSDAEATASCETLLDTLYAENLIGNLMHSPCYINLVNSFHGASLDIFLRQHVSQTQRGTFILDLVRYHIEIMSRRHSGSWVQLDGKNILVLTGFDYPQKIRNKDNLHDYKISNVMSLIADTGWKTDVG